MDHHAGAQVNHGETTSRCVTEGGAHNFEVTNYALLEGMGVDKYITSSPFSVGGYGWNIRFFPDGNKKGAAAGKASAYLCYLGLQAKDGVRAKYTLTMLDDQGNAQEKISKDHVFSPESPIWGTSKFVKKSKLMKSSSSHIRLRCAVVVIKEPPTARQRNPIVVPPPKLPIDLGHTLKDGRGTDVTLLVDHDAEFRAHRFMLAARSPVFCAQLFGPMMDKDTHRIVVDDMEPAIFEMLLHFIYTDSLMLCINEEAYDGVATMQHLLVAADRYGLDRLKVMCEEKLCSSIDTSTVVSTLALANQHYCEGLKDACLEFMSKPGVGADIVLLTDGFKRLMARPTALALVEGIKETMKELPYVVRK